MGYDGLRITGDTACLEKKAWRSLVDYEQEVNKAISKHQIIAVCTYSLDKCGASEVIEAANTHQFAVIQRQGKWAIVQDAEHKWTEQTLRALNEELQATVGQLTLSNRALQDFACVVAHDLKVPLRGIATFARRISSVYRDKLGEDGKVQVDLLLSKVDRMHNFIDGVLDYGRVGRVKAKLVPTNLNELLREVIDMVAPPHNIVITAEGELPVVGCEPTHIMQVFQNLISNAVRFIDKPKGRIGIGCVEENGSWKFSVTDNGPGIEKKYFKKIFELFQTFYRHNEPQGTGIGLWVVKRIVQMYGGEVWVESELGAGSTFFFTWPMTGSVLEDNKAVLSSGL
jgi:signal transduction histidine kinase